MPAVTLRIEPEATATLEIVIVGAGSLGDRVARFEVSVGRGCSNQISRSSFVRSV